VTLSKNIIDWWFKPLDAVQIRWYEVLLTTSFLYYVSSFVPTASDWLGTTGFYLSAEATSAHYITPPSRIPLEWIPWAVFAFFAVGGLHIMGFFRRTCAWLLFISAVYIQAMDQPSAFSMNRLYIVYYFMLGLMPAVFIENGEKKISGWYIRFFQTSLILQYGVAGICKMHSGDWIGRPMTVWTQSQGHYKNPLSAWAVNDLPEPFWWFIWISSLVFEAGAPLLFGWKRTRHATVVFGVLFHFGIAGLMKDLIFFSYQMVTSYIFFVDPKYVHQAEAWLKAKLPWRKK
jgi:hypothetical protein